MHLRLKRLYWQLTALLLATHLAGWPFGMPLALALTAWQVLHFLAVRRRLRDFELQVRVGYLALLLIGHRPGLWPLNVVLFVGLNAMPVAEYCPLARLLVLLPWNRGRPLSWALLRWLALAPPAPGSIRDRLPAPA